ncbi:MAG: methyltransferase domain-containing protein [Verrucomicrobiota bacterium]|nr:methyltransferase domain-containing protein [Verrucomicrobiota bacterium]
MSALNTESAVRERYAAGAKTPEAKLCCPTDYNPQYLEAIPQEVIERDYGCGDPSQYLRAGETVLDLGSGTGKICFIAAQVVGEKGRVIGVDMTDEMLSVARRNAPIVAERLGFANVEFRKGRIQDLALVEFYFADYGWVSFDISETQKVVKKIEQNTTLDDAAKGEKIKGVMERFEKGFRDNTWYKVANGTSYPLVPATKSGTPPLVRTAVIEADGKPLQDPDPGNANLREFAWMTVANFNPSTPVESPFK